MVNLSLFFSDGLSLHSPGCPGIPYVDQASIKLTEIQLPLTPVLVNHYCHLDGILTHPSKTPMDMSMTHFQRGFTEEGKLILNVDGTIP